MYVYSEFTVLLKDYSEVWIISILICVVVIVRHCCQQRRKFFSVVAHSPENYRRCCLQRCYFFRVVAYNAEKYYNFSSCAFFCVVAYNADNCFALWATARKTVGSSLHVLTRLLLLIFFVVFIFFLDRYGIAWTYGINPLILRKSSQIAKIEIPVQAERDCLTYIKGNSNGSLMPTGGCETKRSPLYILRIPARGGYVVKT